jgi:hypothetical protein
MPSYAVYHSSCIKFCKGAHYGLQLGSKYASVDKLKKLV